MDVKATQLAALTQALSQAQVDPEQGRHGEFDHWRRIFETADQRGGPSPAQAVLGLEEAASASRSAPTSAFAGVPVSTSAGPITVSRARMPPSSPVATAHATPARMVHPSDGAAWPLAPRAGQLVPAAAPVESVEGLASGLAHDRAGGTPRATATDARPLSQLEARLSRQADGGLQVLLRAPRSLSIAQALHAVAQALSDQGETASVNQVLLNGRPIYRSTEAPAHRFELDC